LTRFTFSHTVPVTNDCAVCFLTGFEPWHLEAVKRFEAEHARRSRRNRRRGCGGGVTCYFLDEVGRVTMDGRVTPFPVPNHFHGNYPDTLEGIATGASNDMWFTEEAANRIGRISTS